MTVEELRNEIVRRHGKLSKRRQQIGRYILDHPNEVALETLAVIASRCGVQPSAIVRFAKTFEFEGAGQMQKLLCDSLLSNNAALGHAERIRRLKNAAQADAASSTLLSEFVEGNRLALSNLLQTVSEADIGNAVDAIIRAETVHVVGSGFVHKPKMHFEAPPSHNVPQEMQSFLAWFAASRPTGEKPLPALTRAGIAHLYFVTIHPFEDGDGRIARALAEKALSQAIG